MGNHLKKYRKEGNLTLQMLGDMCGLCKSRMHDLEQQGTSSPTLLTVYKICKSAR
jgi:DNA-binding XRE family transcriptional regulator